MLKHLRARTPFVFALGVLFLGIFISERFMLYDAIPQFDKFMHMLGGLAAAWFGLALMQREITHLPFWKQVLIFVSFATLVGVLWEFAEYAANFSPFWLYHWFHGGDLADTLGDLAGDISGAVLFSLWALRAERKK